MMNAAPSDAATRIQSNMAVMRGWIDAHNRQDVDGALVFFDKDIEIEEVPTGVKYRGIDAIREMAKVAYGAQGYKEIVNLFSSEDWACVEYVAKAKLSGAADISGPTIVGDVKRGVNVAPGREEVEMKVCYLAHFTAEGKIGHVREYYDMLSVMTQLGVDVREVAEEGAGQRDAGVTERPRIPPPKSSGGQGSFPPCIEELRKRFSDPTIKESLEGFDQTLQISLTDLDENYVFTIKNGKLTKVDKRNLPDAGIVVTVTSAVFEGILNKTSNPMMAYLKGKFKMKGARDDLMRLQKVLG